MRPCSRSSRASITRIRGGDARPIGSCRAASPDLCAGRKRTPRERARSPPGGGGVLPAWRHGLGPEETRSSRRGGGVLPTTWIRPSRRETRVFPRRSRVLPAKGRRPSGRDGSLLPGQRARSSHREESSSGRGERSLPWSSPRLAGRENQLPRAIKSAPSVGTYGQPREVAGDCRSIIFLRKTLRSRR